MADTTDSILATTGTRPAETGPGAGGGTPTGGGVAVPTDQTLMGAGGSEIGDTAGIGGPSDTSIAEEDGGGAAPMASPAGGDEPESDAPTGGLSSTGTIGGVPTGATESGMSSPTGPTAGGGGLSTPGTGKS